jgi:hypothetical protein
MQRKYATKKFVKKATLKDFGLQQSNGLNLPMLSLIVVVIYVTVSLVL